MAYEWDFAFVARYWPLLVDGLIRTLQLAALSILIGFAAGLPIAFARMSRSLLLRGLARVYIEIFRNIPSIIILFWVFYLVPILTGRASQPFLAALIAFSSYAAAYAAEIYRSGVESVDKGQVEAGRAIGFGGPAIMRYIVLPQAIRRIVPALTNEVIDVVKTTALASTIAYPELLAQAKLLSETEYRPLEAYTVAAALFIGVLLILTFASSALEKRLATT